MHRRMLPIGVAALVCLAPLYAQHTPPLKFQLIDIQKQIQGYDVNTLMKKPPTPQTLNFGRFFQKMSVSGFPTRAASGQLPASFKVPTTANPLSGKIPFIKGATP